MGNVSNLIWDGENPPPRPAPPMGVYCDPVGSPSELSDRQSPVIAAPASWGQYQQHQDGVSATWTIRSATGEWWRTESSSVAGLTKNAGYLSTSRISSPVYAVRQDLAGPVWGPGSAAAARLQAEGQAPRPEVLAQERLRIPFRPRQRNLQAHLEAEVTALPVPRPPPNRRVQARQRSNNLLRTRRFLVSWCGWWSFVSFPRPDLVARWATTPDCWHRLSIKISETSKST